MPATDRRGGPAGGHAGTPAVECRDLVVRYGAVTAVDGLSFTAASGRVLAVLGPNGAGKTSTVETLEGFRRRAGGTVRVLGLDPAADHRALVARVGVMLQRGGVYPTMTPRQALHLFARYYDEPENPDDLLDRTGLTGVGSTPWRRLSGGEQQRLGMALALVGRPDVLFLDEPTAGVDPEGRLVIRQLVAERRAAGCCVLLTTHELAEAERMADDVLIVDRGRVVAHGTPAELAAGAGEDAIRFTGPPGLDRAELAVAAGVAASAVSEPQPTRYEVHGTVSSARVAAVAQWMADRGLPISELRTSGASLEDVYLRLTGAGAAAGDAPGASGAPRARRVPPPRRRDGNRR